MDPNADVDTNANVDKNADVGTNADANTTPVVTEPAADPLLRHIQDKRVIILPGDPQEKTAWDGPVAPQSLESIAQCVRKLVAAPAPFRVVDLVGPKVWRVKFEIAESPKYFMKTMRREKQRSMYFDVARFAQIRVIVAAVTCQLLRVGASAITCPDGARVEKVWLEATQQHAWTSAPVLISHADGRNIGPLDPIPSHWRVLVQSTSQSTYAVDVTAVGQTPLIRPGAQQVQQQQQPEQLFKLRGLLAAHKPFCDEFPHRVVKHMRDQHRRYKRNKRRRARRAKTRASAESKNE